MIKISPIINNYALVKVEMWKTQFPLISILAALMLSTQATINLNQTKHTNLAELISSHCKL